MKPIAITTQFKPFSHQPGVSVPFPLLQLVFVIYPSKIKIIDWKRDQKVLMTLKFKYKSPCKKFSAFYDLLKNKIQVQCHLEDNFVEFNMQYEEKKNHFTLSLNRYKEEYLSFEVKRPNKTSIIRRRLTKKKPLVLFKDLEVSMPKGFEILFLGSHKKQEIEKVFARKDIREFLPLWFLWGQTSPIKPSLSQKEGTLVFLSHLQEKIEKKEHNLISPYLKNIISSSFSAMMVPYLEDFKHWGFYLPRLTSTRVSPWRILAELYKVTRQFFIHSNKSDIYILPHLPPELHCGKCIKIKEENLTIHLEWTKKLIRRMIIFASKNTTVNLHFQSSVKRFRMKNTKNGAGKYYENHGEFVLKRNKAYYFDRFEK